MAGTHVQPRSVDTGADAGTLPPGVSSALCPSLALCRGASAAPRTGRAARTRVSRSHPGREARRDNDVALGASSLLAPRSADQNRPVH